MDNRHLDVSVVCCCCCHVQSRKGGVFIFQNISKSVQLQGYILVLVMILFYKDKCNLQKTHNATFLQHRNTLPVFRTSRLQGFLIICYGVVKIPEVPPYLCVGFWLLRWCLSETVAQKNELSVARQMGQTVAPIRGS